MGTGTVLGIGAQVSFNLLSQGIRCVKLTPMFVILAIVVLTVSPVTESANVKLPSGE